MNIIPLADIVQYAAARRWPGKDWAFLYLRKDKDESDVTTGEILQFLQYRLQGLDSAVHHTADADHFVAIFHNKEQVSLSGIERTAQKTFGSKSFSFLSGDLSVTSLHSLITVFSSMNGGHSQIISNLIRRLGRAVNVAMVLDDDMMVLKMMENILKPFCSVSLFQEAVLFQDAYTELMPDIVFVDIHLRGTRGYEAITAIKETIDPFIHSVMISSDATKDTVMAVKNVVVQGYLVKPFNRESVYSQLTKAPTFISGI